MKRFWESERSRVNRLARSRALFVFSRATFSFFIFCTAFYCLLFYVPFSRHVLFGWEVVPALNVFARYHALWFWLTAVPALVTVIPYLREAELRRSTIGLFVMLGVSGVALSIHPL